MMATKPTGKTAIAERLRENLARVQAIRNEANRQPIQAERRLRLKRWQVERLSRTYADLLVHPRYREAAEFFRSDLYGPRDFTQRDRDVERIYPALVRILPAGALEAVGTALELDALSEELDRDLAAILWDEMKCADGIDDTLYAEGYRRAGKRPLRERQVAVINELGRDLDRLVRVPLLYTSLKMMRQPAKFAGLAELQGFLERGFTAFRDMGGADEFMDIIVRRETRILERIFAHHPGPFDIE